MTPLLMVLLAGFVASVVCAVVAVRNSRSYAAQVLLAVLLVPPTLFCVFGFVATFEPMDATTQWIYRIGYVALGLGLGVTSVSLLVKRSSPTAALRNEKT